MIGIYSITNKINGCVYIGESFNIERRWEEHSEDLINRIHGNYLLQKDYDDYGNVFEYEVLQELNYNKEITSAIRMQSLLIMLEDAYIRRYKEYGYNLYNIENTLDKLLSNKKEFYFANDFSTASLYSYYIKYEYIFNSINNIFELVERKTLFNLINNNCSLKSSSRIREIQDYILNDLKEKDLYESYIINTLQYSYSKPNGEVITLIAYELNSNGISYVTNNYDFESFRKYKKIYDKNTFQDLKKILIDKNIVCGKRAYRDMKRLLMQEQYISTDTTSTGYSIPLDCAVKKGYVHISKYITKHDRYSFYITTKGVENLINKYGSNKE